MQSDERGILEEEVAVSDGASQTERQAPALAPDYFRIDERDMRELMAETVRLAQHLPFCEQNDERPAGRDWSAFFTDQRGATDWFESEQSWLDAMEIFRSTGRVSPQLALYLAFLKLYSHAQQHLNSLTESHLDQYYRRVLQLQPVPPRPDIVHVTCQLAKGVERHRLAAGTLLSAGRDVEGNDLRYSTTEEIVVNRANVASLRTVHASTINSRDLLVDVAPVANSKDGRGQPFDTDAPSWPAFGREPADRAPVQDVDELELGFALSAPELRLKSGIRRLTLTVEFEGGVAPEPPNVEGYVTGAEGWVLLRPADSTDDDPLPAGLLRLEFSLPASEPAVVAVDKELHGDGFDTAWPVLKVVLLSDSNTGAYKSYRELAKYKVQGINLTIAVSDVSPTKLANDWGPLNGEQAFYPFGPQPTLDSSFYVDLEEARDKPLVHVSAHLNWLDLPQLNFGSHYAAYSSDKIKPPISNSSFRVDASVMGTPKRSNSEVNENGDRLFADSDTPSPPAPASTHSLSFEIGTDDSVDEGTALFEFKLTAPTVPFRAFGHQEYPRVQTRFAMEEARVVAEIAAGTAKPEDGDDQKREAPNLPYLPVLKSITVNYVATMRFSDANSKMFHLEPFGVTPVNRSEHSSDTRPTLVPAFDVEGQLYIGISHAKPPQTIKLLFQVEENTAKSGIELVDEGIQWSQLGDNAWHPFELQNQVQDGTRSFRESGIITLPMSGAASAENTTLPGGLHWVRATLRRNTSAVCEISAVHSQAVAAELVSTDPAPPHLAAGLPSGTIEGLVVKDGKIKEVTQPFSSSHGRPLESEDRFRTRVSERLRHKNRASTLWDYERLVLEEFPEIYRVECLSNQRRTLSGELREIAGHVLVIVIPNVRRDSAHLTLQPTASVALRERIRDFLESRTSPFVSIQVDNPIYEELTASMHVQFQPTLSFGYYRDELNMAVKRFLSPWSYEESGDISFGGRVHESALQAFVEKLPYVSYLSDFSFEGANGHQYISSRPDAVVVSAEQHQIIESTH